MLFGIAETDSPIHKQVSFTHHLFGIAAKDKPHHQSPPINNNCQSHITYLGLLRVIVPPSIPTHKQQLHKLQMRLLLVYLRQDTPGSSSSFQSCSGNRTVWWKPSPVIIYRLCKYKSQRRGDLGNLARKKKKSAIKEVRMRRESRDNQEITAILTLTLHHLLTCRYSLFKS